MTKRDKKATKWLKNRQKLQPVDTYGRAVPIKPEPAYVRQYRDRQAKS